MLPSDFFRLNVVLSFQEDAIGNRLRDLCNAGSSSPEGPSGRKVG